MNRLRISGPSPALLVALLALVVAMSGTAYAALAKNSVGSGQVKNNSLKGKDVKDNKLTGADINESTLVGLASSAPPTVIPATLVPPFTALGFGYATPGFWKDGLGYVHLSGSMQCAAGEATAFTLPVGYRPNAILFMPLAVSSGGGGNLQVTADGKVRPYLSGPATACGIDGTVFLPGGDQARPAPATPGRSVNDR